MKPNTMINLSYDTILAPATVPGTGAISILRLSGPDALLVADKVLVCRHGALSDAHGYSLHFCRAFNSDGSLLDEVLVSVFRAPHSYTGEDGVEISCHASTYIVQELMYKLLDAGARNALPGEFTRRAFLNGKLDLTQAEAVADVIASSSAASHRLAMNQLKGGVSEKLVHLREQLLDLASLMELELDFSEEDVEFADRSRLRALLGDVRTHIDELCSSFRLGNAIRNGVPIAIVGAANTGKSTLLNTLLGEQRAIVSPIAGTTRDTVEDVLNIDGTVFRFIDTAGIRDTDDVVENMGIARTLESMAKSDIVLGVLDINRSADDMIAEAREIVSHIGAEQSLVFVLNKCDSFGEIHGLLDTSFSDFDIFLQTNKNVSVLYKYVSSLDYKVNTVLLSAKEDLGVEDLKNVLVAIQNERVTTDNNGGNAILISNARHYNELCAAATSLSLVASGLDSYTPTDLIVQDLRDALSHLGTILGEVTTDEVLGNIFSRFCVGK